MTSVHIKMEKMYTEMNTERVHVKMKAGFRVMLPHTKECQKRCQKATRSLARGIAQIISHSLQKENSHQQPPEL
jgi:hypothetical protein